MVKKDNALHTNNTVRTNICHVHHKLEIQSTELQSCYLTMLSKECI